MSVIKSILKWLLAILFVFAGANHFVNPNFYLKIMPPFVPWHLFFVYLSGALEIVFGALILIPKFSRFAARGIIAVLICVFPANLYMAICAQKFPEFSAAALYIRLPLQLLLIVWAYWYTKKT